LGAALLSRLVELGWMRRDSASRAISVTPFGVREMRRLLDIEALDLREAKPSLSLLVDGATGPPCSHPTFQESVKQAASR